MVGDCLGSRFFFGSFSWMLYLVFREVFGLNLSFFVGLG